MSLIIPRNDRWLRNPIARDDHFIVCCVKLYKLRKKEANRSSVPVRCQWSLIEMTQFDDEAAIKVQRQRFYGHEASQCMLENRRTDDSDRVGEFFNTEDNFRIPAWLDKVTERFRDKIIANKLEFHASYNIDTFWAKICDCDELEFHHVCVHMCIFESFCELVRRHREDKCALLRYCCMCDKHDRIHCHFVMVSRKADKIHRLFNGNMFGCEITRNRTRLTQLMKENGVVMTPSWPDHRHFRMKTIKSAMHLFNTIKYVGTRESSTTSTIIHHDEYTLLNVTSDVHYDIQRQVEELVKSYTTNLHYSGSHFYIFRSVPHDAPIWFAAVSHKGIHSYVRHLMDSHATIVDELDKVTVKNGQICVLEFRHIINRFAPLAIPLRNDDYLYHNTCKNKLMALGRRDLDRYINLGRNEFVYLAKGNTMCCEEYAKDIFLGGTPQHDMYKQLLDEKDKLIRQNIRLIESLSNSNALLCELRDKIEELANKEATIEHLRKQVAHFSTIVTKKSGFALQSNNITTVV